MAAAAMIANLPRQRHRRHQQGLSEQRLRITEGPIYHDGHSNENVKN